MSKKILFLGLLGILLLTLGASCKEKPPAGQDLTPNPSPVAKTRCENLLANVIIPLEDIQTFEDEEYTSVTTTERAAWDQESLPEEVLNLETKGYNCYPLPLEFEEGKEVPEMNIEPEVSKVQWNCELEYSKYNYLEGSDLETKNSLEEAGFTCEQEECANDQGETFVWFCFQMRLVGSNI